MINVTVTQRIAVFSVLGLFSPGCSSEGETKPSMVVNPAGAAGLSAGTGFPPAAGGAGASVIAGTTATGTAGVIATVAGQTGGAGLAAVGGTGAPAAGSVAAGSGSAGTAAPPSTERFSFFVASWAAMQRVSKSPNGFGGDFRYGQPDGLSGADKICTEIAEFAAPGSGSKGWKAFLSATKGANGQPVHAIDRVGEGPWYDRIGRLVAMNKADLMQQRPKGADPAIINDLPNEDGVPNQAPDGMAVDNHDILTGTNAMGQVFSTDWKFTCHDWTSTVGSDGTPRVGHSWPRMGGMGFPGSGGRGGSRPGGAGAGGGFVPPPFPTGGGGVGGFTGQEGGIDMANWMSSLNEAGCAPGASLVEMGPPIASNPTVGSGGGYGGIYCFALKP
jgi:hypothetical protein